MNNFNNNMDINQLSTLRNKSNREYRNINKKIDETLNEYEKLQRKLKYNTNYINNNNIKIILIIIMIILIILIIIIIIILIILIIL